MWRAGCERPPLLAASDPRHGFTLIELLAVMLVIGLSAGAISLLYRAPAARTELKTLALTTASRLRDLRAAAMATRANRVATFDVAGRSIGFSDGRAPIALSRAVAMTVTAAADEMTARRADVRFYPNGSSSGATIALRRGGQAYEIRINWLTGRVSTEAVR